MADGESRVQFFRRLSGSPSANTRAPTFAAICGVTEMGPIGELANGGIPATSFPEWQRFYGGFTAESRDAALAAKHFFDEGGQFLYTSRVVHCTTNGDTSSKTSAASAVTVNTAAASATAAFVEGNAGPYALANGDTIAWKGNQGSTETATFSGAAVTTSSDTGPFTLSNGQTLTFKVNRSALQTKTFNTGEFSNIAAATALEVRASLNAFLAANQLGAFAEVSSGAVDVTTIRAGTGAYLEFVGGTALTALGFATGEVQGTGNVADLSVVTATEVATVIDAAIAVGTATVVSGKPRITSPTTGLTSYAQVLGSSTAEVKIGFPTAEAQGSAGSAEPTLTLTMKYDGEFGDEFTREVTAASGGDAARFNVYLRRNGVRVLGESWTDLSMNPLDSRYAINVINEGSGSQAKSRYVIASDEGSTLTGASRNPATGTSAFTGGDNGLVGLADTDFVGDAVGNTKTGLRVFNEIEVLDLVSAPGRATSAAHNGLITYCEVYRLGYTFAVLASPEGHRASDSITYVSQTANLTASSENAAFYSPNVYVDNPSSDVFGTAATVLTSPVGAIMGAMCRNDARVGEGGPFEQVSNVTGALKTVRGIEHRDYEDAAIRGQAEAVFINTIRDRRAKPIHIDGAQTLNARAGVFRNVGQSRGAIFIVNSLLFTYEDLRNQNITEPYLKTLSSIADVFLKRLTLKNRFRYSDPKKAYFVDFVSETTPDVVEQDTVIGVLGVSLAGLARYIFIYLQPINDTLAQQLAAA
jgi:hypothetical protein